MLKSLTQQINRSLKRGFEDYKRLVIITSIVFFFLANYHICNYYYPIIDEESTVNWWVLKMDIYAFIILLCFVLASLEKTTNTKVLLIEKFITSIGIGLSISNVIDRHFFDVESYLRTDLMIVLCIFITSYYDFKKLKKIAKDNSNYDTK